MFQSRDAPPPSMPIRWPPLLLPRPLRPLRSLHLWPAQISPPMALSLRHSRPATGWLLLHHRLLHRRGLLLRLHPRPVRVPRVAQSRSKPPLSRRKSKSLCVSWSDLSCHSCSVFAAPGASGLLPHNGHCRDVRQKLTADRSIDGLPRKRLVVDRFDDVHHGHFLAVGQDPFVVNEPTFSAAAPCPFRESAIGVERPRSNALCGSIPSDDLHSGHVDLVSDLNGERADQEVVVLRPVALGLDPGLLILIHPLAHQEFERFQLRIVRRNGLACVIRHAIEQPLPSRCTYTAV